MRFLVAFLSLFLVLPSYGQARSQDSALYGDILAEFHLAYYKGDLKTNSPTGFFGTQNNGGGNQQLGVLIPETDGDYRKTEIGLRLPIKKTPWDIFFAGNYGDTNIGGIAGGFDAGAQTILLPGAGRVGFQVLGPNGVANNLTYSHDYSWANGEVGLGYTYYTNKTAHHSIRPFGGIRYGHLNTNEAFAGNLPIVVREFSYYTNINNNIISPFIGIEASTRPAIINDFLPIKFNAFVRYDLNFNNAKGTDSLAFTGFQIDPVAISEDDETHDFKTGIGFTINPSGGLSFSVGGNFERISNIPRITRTGTANSNLSFDQADIWTGTIRTTLTF